MIGWRHAGEQRKLATGDAHAAGACVAADPADADHQLRLVVLDPSPWTLDQIQNALWMWPHKLVTATSINDAVTQCRHLAPAAVLIANDFPDRSNGDVLVRLRAYLPDMPIIAITSIPGAANTAETLKRGADAVILRNDLQRPTLHDLLMRLRDARRPADAGTGSRQLCLGLPWRDSRMLGSILCDIDGTVIDANAYLARLLEYPGRNALHGKCIWRDVLQPPADWNSLKSVAGDLAAIRHRSVTVRTAAGQVLWMKIEVFAAPESPADIQVTFVDQSERLLVARTGTGNGQ